MFAIRDKRGAVVQELQTKDLAQALLAPEAQASEVGAGAQLVRGAHGTVCAEVVAYKRANMSTGYGWQLTMDGLATTVADDDWDD